MSFTEKFEMFWEKLKESRFDLPMEFKDIIRETMIETRFDDQEKEPAKTPIQGNDDKNVSKFRYVDCYDHSLDDQVCVRSVEFNISRHGKYTHVIAFPKFVTVKVAIKAVEAYLSEPLTRNYYESIKDDTFHEMEWEDAIKYFHCRGHALTDTKFLESTKIDKNGLLIFFIGT